MLAAGFYLWSVRGLFGLLGRTYLPIEIKTPSGTIEIECSIGTPIRPNRSNRLDCIVEMGSWNAIAPQTNPIDVAIAVSGNGSFVSPSDQHALLGAGASHVFRFEVTPTASGLQDLLIATTVANVTRATQLQVDVELRPVEIVLLPLAFALLLAIGGSTIRRTVRVRDQLLAETKARIAEVASKAEQAPEKAKFAWELATVRLEAYFDRNLSQVNQVFWLAVAVTTAGFCFVLWGVVVSLNQPQVSARALVAGVSGIITQFIGATFLVIYRSIMEQANEFIWVLERINTVGMAVQVLDSIPEDQAGLKNATRSNLVSLLLTGSSPRPLKRRPDSHGGQARGAKSEGEGPS